MKFIPLLKHPTYNTIHRPCWYSNRDGSQQVSIFATTCGTSLPGTPPPEGVKREWYHGGFDVINVLPNEVESLPKRCGKCFKL